MNPVMNITMAITRNVSTEDDTAAAREHSAVILDFWIFPDPVLMRTVVQKVLSCEFEDSV